MQSPSRIKPDSAPLHLDASVLINLVASHCMEAILVALGRPILIEEAVCAEFKRDPRDGRSPDELIKELAKRKRITIVKMNEAQFEVFLRLTGASAPDDLGDGEAATLACAADGGYPVLDDKKAVRICSKEFPGKEVYCSLDIFCAKQVYDRLGRPVVANAVYDAIKMARMRIPSGWKLWIAELLGDERSGSIPFLTLPTRKHR